VNVARGEVDPAAQRGLDDLGLLVDLLAHEVLVAAALGLDGAPVDALGGAVDALARGGGDGELARAELGHVAVLEEDHVAGVVEERGDVAAAEHFALAPADDEGRSLAGGDDDLGLVARDDGDGVGAADVLQGLLDGLEEGDLRGSRRCAEGSALELAVDEVRDDLGVGVGEEADALPLELLPHADVVLDDAVVDDGDGPRGVGVGVDLARAAVGGPAGVADAGGAGEGALVEGLAEARELAQGANDFNALTIVNGETRRVVAAVLKPAEAVDDDRRRALRTHITDDPAHLFGLAPPPRLAPAHRI
jgi:hypothetical protein